MKCTCQIAISAFQIRHMSSSVLPVFCHFLHAMQVAPSFLVASLYKRAPASFKLLPGNRHQRPTSHTTDIYTHTATFPENTPVFQSKQATILNKTTACFNSNKSFQSTHASKTNFPVHPRPFPKNILQCRICAKPRHPKKARSQQKNRTKSFVYRKMLLYLPSRKQ